MEVDDGGGGGGGGGGGLRGWAGELYTGGGLEELWGVWRAVIMDLVSAGLVEGGPFAE